LEVLVNALVLFIEDDPEIVDILRVYFEREGFRTVSAGDGAVGLSVQQKLKPDLVVLDVKLPTLDGFGVLAALRRTGDVPVLMLTALTEDIDKLQGLRIGADDYVTKPFNPAEVVARARAILRRTNWQGAELPIRVGRLTVDPAARSVSFITAEGERFLELTKTEFSLLAHIARYPGRVFERAELVDACLPESDASERVVDSHISNLRKKLAGVGADSMLSGVRGVGYRLVRDE
jgi:two-component system response regulator AdeR